jgi:hypothetical protein
MQVHLISVKICVVRVAHAFVESKGPPRTNLDKVTHDTELVERRLTVEEYYIAVLEVAFDDVSRG